MDGLPYAHRSHPSPHPLPLLPPEGSLAGSVRVLTELDIWAGTALGER